MCGDGAMTLTKLRNLTIMGVVLVLAVAYGPDLMGDGDGDRERCGNREVVNMSLEMGVNAATTIRSIKVAVVASLGTIEGNYANANIKAWNFLTDPKKRWAHKFVACVGDALNAEAANVANAPIRSISCYFYSQVGEVDDSEKSEIGDGAFPDYMDITRDYTYGKPDLGRCATTVI
jgi:hypothetical protein